MASRLSEIEVFVQVVEDGSFTSAARTLGISKSYASKQVRALEERLGARLLHRTTRTLTVTDAGRAFADRCRLVLEDLDAAEQAVTALQERPRGTLRITAPMSFGVEHVAPALADFLARYPELDVVADYSDRRVDLVDEGYDLAIRVGRMADSSLIARRLAPVRGLMVASRAYLDRAGRPEAPADLREHDCLVYSLLDTPASWTLHPTAGGEPVRVRVRERLVSNNGEALLQAAMAGVGVVPLPDFLVVEALRRGQVERVLPDWTTMDRAGVWAVYPHSRHLAAKVRLFVDHLADAFRDPPWTLESTPDLGPTAASPAPGP
jgi:DNA-binding transcriptional LysR family regulator